MQSELLESNDVALSFGKANRARIYDWLKDPSENNSLSMDSLRWALHNNQTEYEHTDN